ncbi:MAG: hypothetical protein K2H16_06160 [Prevotella sp.]|nr:hypothetical protein [Prevotella sp.]
MAMTAAEKNELKEAVLNEIRAESSDITKLASAVSLGGLAGIPAVQGDKLVLVPMPMLYAGLAGLEKDETAVNPFTDVTGVLSYDAELVMTVGDTNLWCLALKFSDSEDQLIKAVYNGEAISMKRFYVEKEEPYIWFMALPKTAGKGSCELDW